eukprot:CAMPEP_0198244116 /NCGR_PEP_ID=MMETSP1446-20131203/33080_1 /TAXON_ID=1461542 ORGANISM="Unidentified sp, Strain CCMP2111" /NCGR_SAMPLE_ID=MMETSP1446 /ASSEMBLY_ACC=CAM_ASM_001112 /LENGTH=52 /DNA_ID=CAMNT_0043928087 /DNA_START=137 /DNA_END=292 /DNA_ORIENTATION=-
MSTSEHFFSPVSDATLPTISIVSGAVAVMQRSRPAEPMPMQSRIDTAWFPVS